VIFTTHELGPLSTNTYLVASEHEKKAIIIDPADESEAMVNIIEGSGFELVGIINTHDHRDHTSGNCILKKHFDVPIHIHNDDAERLLLPQDLVLNLWFRGEGSPPADIILKDGDKIEVGDVCLEVIHTPGHTPGGICLLVRDENVLFSGDTIMAGSIGRTDLVGGSYEDIIKSIKARLLVLDDSVKIFPGHGGSSTIGNEKKYNIFLK